MSGLLASPWIQLAVTVLGLIVSIASTVHVLLHKSETRSAIGWIGLIWLSPFIGSVLYVLLGINRIRRQAQRLRHRATRHSRSRRVVAIRSVDPTTTHELRHLLPVARLVHHLVGRPLRPGNEIQPLDGGDQAYPAMLAAIDRAERSIALLTYIFYPDRAGRPIIEGLRRAVRRGVEVRVLIDDLGSRYGFTSAIRPLQRAGVRVARFNPTLRPGWARYANLRNHRKLLVVDGREGFTGGMNILEDYLLSIRPRSPKRDLHFFVRGPIVAEFQEIFASDWAFSTGEILEGESWFPPIENQAGSTVARGIADGPDDGADRIALTLMGALACAQSSVTIITPYFIPEPPLHSALGVAALRGVEVDLFIPRENNHRLVQWAMMPYLEPLLESGCRVWHTEPPFDHTKLIVIDGLWTLLGSANLDPRSLVLNFEYVLECYDHRLATSLAALVESRRAGATRLTLEEVRSRTLPLRLRDALARLLSPYL